MKCGVKPVHPIPAHQLKTIPPKLPTPQLHRAGQKKQPEVTFKAAKRGRSSCQTFEGLVVFQCVEIKCWTIQLLYGLKLPSFRCLDKIHGICNYILDCDLVCWSFLVHSSFFKTIWSVARWSAQWDFLEDSTAVAAFDI